MSIKNYLLLIMFLLCISGVAACGQRNDTSQSVTTTAPTSHIPTVHPTPLPTRTSTPLPTRTPTPQSTPSYLRATHGPVVLGVSVGNFFGKYGNSLVTLDHGYTWVVDKDGNPYELIGATFHTDGIVYRVDIVNETQSDWSVAQSAQECSRFLPTGSNFEQQVDDQIARYTSPAGEIHMERENQQGDCFLQFSNTIGTASGTFQVLS